MKIYEFENAQLKDFSGWYVPAEDLLIKFTYGGHSKFISEALNKKAIEINDRLAELAIDDARTELKSRLGLISQYDLMNVLGWVRVNNNGHTAVISSRSNDFNMLYNLFSRLKKALGKEVIMETDRRTFTFETNEVDSKDDLVGVGMRNRYAGKDYAFVVLQKPLAVGKEDEIENMIMFAGGDIVGTKRVNVKDVLIKEHYKQFLGEEFFDKILSYYSGKKLMVWLAMGNDEVLNNIRREIGSWKVDKDSFREFLVGDKWNDVYKKYGIIDNGIHVSDSKKEGEREKKVWFGS